MRSRIDSVIARLGELAPGAVSRPLLRAALKDQAVALCLHRVGRRRPTDWQPHLCIEEDKLDRLIELLLSIRPRAARGWLTVSFDDGYEDAAAYVAERAHRFPAVEFLLFVCPQKAELNAGFRWDLAERRLAEGEPRPFDTGPVELDGENQRPDLREVASRPEFRLASVEALRRLQRLRNVSLGNHTNCHFAATELTREQARHEYERSHSAFTRLFGDTRHFAFPFGGPHHHFDASHVALLRGLGDFVMWTTEPRPYEPSDRKPGAVLPRFSPNGKWSPNGIATWIAARALHARVTRPLAVRW